MLHYSQDSKQSEGKLLAGAGQVYAVSTKSNLPLQLNMPGILHFCRMLAERKLLMKIRGLHIILIIIISAFIGYYIGVNKVSFDWKNYKPHVTVLSKEPPARATNVDFSLFWKTWGKLEDTYYDKKAIDAEKLVNGAITGMVESLGDPYTVFLPPVQNNDFKEGLSGQKFEGIGAELGMKDKQIIVVAPLDGMPAKKAGIRAGDAILKVDNLATTGWTLVQAVEKIRGEKGTTVTLTILHRDENKPQDVKIVRDTIRVKSVDGWVKAIREIESIKSTTPSTGSASSLQASIKGKEDQKIVYIRISQFGDKTNQEWLSVVNNVTLSISQNKDIVGLILDLRNNPGGYLQDATFIASEFIKSGTIVIEERGSGEQTRFTVSRNGSFTTIPMVVLINKGSASASEIVAGALRDQRGVKLIGETSFGKGTIQQAEELGEGAGLHVTIAKWLTPNSIWVHGKGLTPDISVSLDEKEDGHDLQLERAVEELVK